MAMPKTLLKVENLGVRLGETHILKGLSFWVGEGELVTIIGANGAGKTTTMRAIMGLVPSLKGASIRFGDVELVNQPAWRRAELGIGYIPEGRRIFPELTVEQNLTVGGFSCRDKNRLRRGVEEAYELFPILAERRRQPGNTLSGGEQQMLAIGRALVSGPRILLIDEISMGLMPLMVERVFAIIQALRDAGKTMLLVEQNSRKALAIADRGYLLETGQIVLAQPAAELAANEEVKRAYLGG